MRALVFAIGYSDATCGTSFAATLDSKGGQYTVFAPTNAAFASTCSRRRSSPHCGERCGAPLFSAAVAEHIGFPLSADPYQPPGSACATSP